METRSMFLGVAEPIDLDPAWTINSILAFYLLFFIADSILFNLSIK